MIDRYMRLGVQATKFIGEDRGLFIYGGKFKQNQVTILSREELPLKGSHDCVATNFHDDGSPKTVKPLAQLSEYDKLMLADLHNHQFTVKDLEGENPKDEFGQPRIKKGTEPKKPDLVELVAFHSHWSMYEEYEEYGGRLRDGHRFKVEGSYSGMMPEFEGRILPYQYIRTYVNQDGTRVVFVVPSAYLVNKLQDEKRQAYQPKLDEIVGNATARLHLFDLIGLEKQEDAHLKIVREALHTYRIDNLKDNLKSFQNLRQLLEALEELDRVFVLKFLGYTRIRENLETSVETIFGEGTRLVDVGVPLGFINWKLLNASVCSPEIVRDKRVLTYNQMIWSILHNFQDKTEDTTQFRFPYGYEKRKKMQIFKGLPKAVSESKVDLDELLVMRDDVLSLLEKVHGNPFVDDLRNMGGLKPIINAGYYLLGERREWFFGEDWQKFVESFL